MKILYVLFIGFLCFVSCSPKIDSNKNEGEELIGKSEELSRARVKNVILMIGDGMGIPQITAGIYSSESALNLERFKIVGLHKNHSASDLITDSAAGATAFASGILTYNKAVGVDIDTQAVQTILEEAELKGLGTAMVVTSVITHATPGPFIAHVPDRYSYEHIASEFLNTDIDFFVGGGLKYFERRETDDRNLIQELEKKNYTISNFTKEELLDVNIAKADKFGYFTAQESPLPFSQGRDYLLDATDLALSFMTRKHSDGFFMMIEGSQIDWGGHANDEPYMTSELLEFDRTIGKVLDYAERDGETLVIVTGDHECGGFNILRGSTKDSLVISFATPKHTLQLIPVFAFGPGAEAFKGIYDNKDIYGKMRDAYGW